MEPRWIPKGLHDPMYLIYLECYLPIVYQGHAGLSVATVGAGR